jgi:hypothetical protein
VNRIFLMLSTESGRKATQFAVVSFLVELCETPGCSDPVLSSIFAAADDIAVPGEAIMTGPLFFEELVRSFNSNQIYR